MASPVRDAKDKVQAQFPGASVHSRGRGWIKHQHPSEPNRHIYQTQAGNRGWHFGQGPFTEANEVDTAWVASGGLWDWESIKNDFHSYIRDSVPVSYRYVDAETSHFVELTFDAVEWVNDEEESENAATFSQVTPVIDDGNIIWNDIATGWDVEVQAQTGRLAKWIHIDSLANLGSPTIGGTNIRLRLSLTWQTSSGLEIWVDGTQWDKKNNTWAETSGDIEFRDEITQQPVFGFENPKGYDAEGEAPLMVQRVRRTGVNFYSEIETPWSWLQNATFPIKLDDTVNPQVGANDEDAHERADGSGFNSNSSTVNCGSSIVPTNGFIGGWLFDPVNVPKDATISSNTYFEVYIDDASYNDLNTDFGCESVDDAVDFTADADVLTRWGTVTTDKTFMDEDDVSGWIGSGYDFSDPIDEIITRAGWASGQGICVLARGDTVANLRCYTKSHDADSNTAAKLYIDYTSGAADLNVDIGADEAEYQGTGVRILGP